MPILPFVRIFFAHVVSVREDIQNSEPRLRSQCTLRHVASSRFETHVLGVTGKCIVHIRPSQLHVTNTRTRRRIWTETLHTYLLTEERITLTPFQCCLGLLHGAQQILCITELQTQEREKNKKHNNQKQHQEKPTDSTQEHTTGTTIETNHQTKWMTPGELLMCCVVRGLVYPANSSNPRRDTPTTPDTPDNSPNSRQYNLPTNCHFSINVNFQTNKNQQQ